jgi:predicted TIM-barrel fold metal-dependent hydrolase
MTFQLAMWLSMFRWVQVTNQLIASADESDQRKLLHENAVRIYGAHK